MDLTKPVKTLAVLGGAFLLILPIIGIIKDFILLSTYEIGSVTYKISPTYFWLILILNFFFGIGILINSSNRQSFSYKWGVYYLVLGVLSAGLNFGTSIMLAGILLMLAGFLALVVNSNAQQDDEDLFTKLQRQNKG